MTGDGRRPRRVAELIRSHLVQLMAREIDDQRLAALVITRVEVPDDLGVAWIYVRLMIGDEEERSRRAVLRSLRRANPRLRRLLSPRLGLRRMPELRFQWDTGQDASERVEQILGEIAAERDESDDAAKSLKRDD